MDLKLRAELLQEVAESAWAAVVRDYAQKQGVPWKAMLDAAARAGLDMNKLRIAFKASTTTFDRWVIGFASPSITLRSELDQQIVSMLEGK